MPAYNAASYISEAIKSVQAQTFSSWELLIVNDCSTDKTKDLAESFSRTDRRIRCFHLTTNSGGPAKPRNIGIAHAAGTWIAFLDADDIWLKEKLAIQFNILKQRKLSLLCSTIKDFKITSKTIELPKLEQYNHKIYSISYRKLLFKNIIPTSSVICTKKSILHVGGFNEDRKLVAVEDYDLWLRLLNNNFKILKLCIPLVNYRVVPTGLSRNKFTMIKKNFFLLFNRTINDSPSLTILLPFCFIYYSISSLLRIFFTATKE